MSARNTRRKPRSPFLIPGVVALVVVQTLLIAVGVVILLQRWSRPSEPEPAEPEASPIVPVAKAVLEKVPAAKAPVKSAPAPEPVADPLIPAGLPVVAVLAAHSQPILGVTYSPDGRHLVTTCHDGTMRVWDVAAREPKRLYDRNEGVGPLGSPVFSPDGRMFAVPGRRGTLLFDASPAAPSRRAVLPGGQLLFADEAHPCPEQPLAFYPDGKWLAVRDAAPGRENVLNVWDLTAPQPRTVVAQPYPGETTLCVSVAPQRTVATGGMKGAFGYTAFDPNSNSSWGAGSTPVGSPIVAVQFSADGESLALTTQNGKVGSYFDWAHNGPRTRVRWDKEVKGHDGWATVVGFTSDPKTFVTRGQDRLAVWWQITDRAHRGREWQLPDGIDLWRFSPDGRFAALRVPHERIAIVKLPRPFEQP